MNVLTQSFLFCPKQFLSYKSSLMGHPFWPTLYKLLKAFQANLLPQRHLAKGCTKQLLDVTRIELAPLESGAARNLARTNQESIQIWFDLRRVRKIFLSFLKILSNEIIFSLKLQTYFSFHRDSSVQSEVSKTSTGLVMIFGNYKFNFHTSFQDVIIFNVLQ